MMVWCWYLYKIKLLRYILRSTSLFWFPVKPLDRNESIVIQVPIPLVSTGPHSFKIRHSFKNNQKTNKKLLQQKGLFPVLYRIRFSYRFRWCYWTCFKEEEKNTIAMILCFNTNHAQQEMFDIGEALFHYHLFHKKGKQI